MKFKLKTSGNSYTDEEKKKLEKLGFEFKPMVDSSLPERLGLKWYIDDDFYPEIEINHLDDLMYLFGEYGALIIFGGNVIEIYNEYRE